jgi:hypothetical protein
MAAAPEAETMTHLSDDATIVGDSSALPVVRDTGLLSAALASHSAMLSLTAAVASITSSECSTSRRSS